MAADDKRSPHKGKPKRAKTPARERGPRRPRGDPTPSAAHSPPDPPIVGAIQKAIGNDGYPILRFHVHFADAPDLGEISSVVAGITDGLRGFDRTRSTDASLQRAIPSGPAEYRVLKIRTGTNFWLEGALVFGAAVAQNAFAISVAAGVVGNYITKFMDVVLSTVGGRRDVAEIRRMVDAITQTPNITDASVDYVRLRRNGTIEVAAKVDIKSNPHPGQTFVLNRRTKMVHASECPSVVQIETQNKEEVSTLGDALARGFKPHQKCLPGH